PIATLGEEVSQRVIVCTSSSKTFNIAGLQNANIMIPNQKLREVYRRQIARSGYSEPNTFGLVACMSAYEKGEQWLDELLVYLQENLEFVHNFLETRIPKIHLVWPEGTYLLWLDCSELQLSYKELEKLFVDKAHLWLDAGRIFGKASSQFERLNIACPRSVLEQALT
ncbi:MAG: aminotransferase class I/II-fold pyridoxal phosphate-dependent enzyme, partial [Clostridiales bacterium]|nr:aminotransferase class I/II-fold pyridoxal phosphate-dependent enzyme [Clostridiales bacterium]